MKVSDGQVLVGKDENAAGVMGYLTKPDEIVRVQSPEELGHYLQSL